MLSFEKNFINRRLSGRILSKTDFFVCMFAGDIQFSPRPFAGACNCAVADFLSVTREGGERRSPYDIRNYLLKLFARIGAPFVP